ncbi:MAG: glycosyltransferase family 9 protein [Deltaproteobacteria bacterium]|nr:glycosyltransferase family 9 protein [Deltaproteobacteria bacterium]
MKPLADCKNILVIRLSAIGDVLRTLPAINAWRRYNPEAQFTWLVEPAAASLLEGHAALDRVLVFERGLFRGWLRSPRRLGTALRKLFTLLLELRSAKFELAVDFHGIFKSGLLARLSGAPVRVGFARPAAKEGSHFFYTLHFRPSDPELNRVDRALALAAFLGVELAGPVIYQLPVGPAHQQRARESLAAFAEFPNSGPLIALHPGSSKKTAYKRWHQNGYVGLINALVENLGARVVLTWGPGERETVELIAGNLRVPVVVARKTVSLLDLAAIFAACDLYIGGDTGPMHLAVAMGTPVVAIFGPTHPQINAPCGASYRIVRHPLHCSPCRKRSCRTRLCLEAIGWRRVYAEVQELLAMVKLNNGPE